MNQDRDRRVRSSGKNSDTRLNEEEPREPGTLTFQERETQVPNGESEVYN